MGRKAHHRNEFVLTATTTLTLLSCAAAIGTPKLPYDHETIATCYFWSEVFAHESQTCEAFRDRWSFTPEQFHEFNPSVDVDCKGFKKGTSYCVCDDARNDEWWETATGRATGIESRPTTTSSAPGAAVTVEGTTVPYPMAWRDVGCYRLPAEGGKVLADQVAYGGKLLAREVCQAECWKRLSGKTSFYTGLKNGNECWCGRQMLAGVDDAEFSGFECKRKRCPGNMNQTCGGEKAMLVYEPIVIYGTGKPWSGSPSSTQSSNPGPTGGSGQQSRAYSVQDHGCRVEVLAIAGLMGALIALL